MPGGVLQVVIGLLSPVIGLVTVELKMNLNSPLGSRCVWRVWRSRARRGPGESSRSGRAETRTAETFRGGQDTEDELGEVLKSAPAGQLALWPRRARTCTAVSRLVGDDSRRDFQDVHNFFFFFYIIIFKSKPEL